MNKPNVVFIYADDLGAGMLSAYGQSYFETPNIDRICHEGIDFRNAHGCHICAPARASLLCGVHDSHCGQWGFTASGLYMEHLHGRMSEEKIDELLQKSGIDNMTDGVYLPMIFKEAGYKTYEVGKLDWGFTTCPREVKAHGWDEHYGFYDHWVCQGYYAPEIHDNGVAVSVEGNTNPNCGRGQYAYVDGVFQKVGDDDAMGRKVFIPELLDKKALEYIEKSKDEPFFLHYPTPLTHAELSILEMAPEVADREDLNLSEKLYASMVIYLDKSVGKILDKLEELNILDHTLVVFSSDNGHSAHYARERIGRVTGPLNVNRFGQTLDDVNVRYTSEDFSDVFNGNNGRTGRKSHNFEGGTRVPLFMRLPKVIAPGTVSNALVANYDFLDTMAEMLGVTRYPNKDSKSYWKHLQSAADFEEHDHIVFASAYGPAVINKDGFKLRAHLNDNYKMDTFGNSWQTFLDGVVLELYDLKDDFREEHNLKDTYPEITNELLGTLLRECDGNLLHGTTGPHFVFVGDTTYQPYYAIGKNL